MRIVRLAASPLLLAGLLAGCSGESLTESSAPALAVTGAGHNAADHFSGVDPVQFDITSPCNGEQIILVGTGSYEVTFVDTREHLDGGNAIHSETLLRTLATGIGQTTGTFYTLTDVYHVVQQSPSPPAPQVTFSEHGTTQVTTDVAGLSFGGRFQFHFVGLPTGGFKVTRDFATEACKG